MKVTPQWLRELVDYKVDVRQLADDLTLAGIAVESVSGEGGNAVFEMDITTNRVDAMNHYGIAREISAIYDFDLKPLQAKLPEAKGKANFPIEIEVPQFCTRFTGQVIRNVKIGPSSSAAVQQRFAALQQKPINNAADATNYVLLEMGKPTHAFDLDKLEGGKLVIRMARPGESLKTLDGVERRLHPEDVVVADARKPVGLAGVMGGWDTMITTATRNVLIESAWWDPAVVRKTSRRHGMHTDASHRFERGADWASCPLSCELVAQIILESGGGELEGGLIDVIAKKFERQPIRLRLAEVRRILGQEIPSREIERILRRLGFATLPARLAASRSPSIGSTIVEEPCDYQIEAPSWRLDIEREIDVIEEIARVHGYNKFANKLPSFSGGVVETPEALKLEKVRGTLLALGYNEALSNTFIARADSETFASDAVVQIANPLSEEASAMRTSLAPGMLEMLARNLNRGTENVRLFESGHIYAMKGDATNERLALCIGATGAAFSTAAKLSTPSETFRALKGDIEALLLSFEHDSLHFDPKLGTPAEHYFHPGRSARAVLNGAEVARLGEIHPEIAAARKIKHQVFIAEIQLERLFQQPLHIPVYRQLSRFPAVERDFSFAFDDAVSYQHIERAISAFELDALRRIEPVEIFRGGNVTAGKYSVLLRATFQSAERTLRDDEVAAWSARIVEALKQLGGTQRA